MIAERGSHISVVVGPKTLPKLALRAIRANLKFAAARSVEQQSADYISKSDDLGIARVWEEVSNVGGGRL